MTSKHYCLGDITETTLRNEVPCPVCDDPHYLEELGIGFTCNSTNTFWSDDGKQHANLGEFGVGAVEWRPPLCCICYAETMVDADAITCEACGIAWNHDGETPEVQSADKLIKQIREGRAW